VSIIQNHSLGDTLATSCPLSFSALLTRFRQFTPVAAGLKTCEKPFKTVWRSVSCTYTFPRQSTLLRIRTECLWSPLSYYLDRLISLVIALAGRAYNMVFILSCQSSTDNVKIQESDTIYPVLLLSEKVHEITKYNLVIRRD